MDLNWENVGYSISRLFIATSDGVGPGSLEMSYSLASGVNLTGSGESCCLIGALNGEEFNKQGNKINEKIKKTL